MRRILASLAFLFLGGCVSAGSTSGPLGSSGPLGGKYDGADAGYLILTLGAQAGTAYSDYAIFFRKRDGSASGSIWWGQGNMFDRRKLDIDDNKEKALVDVRRLPPGDYEVFNFDVHMNGGTIQESWRARRNFSIPFTIAPGGATYLGEFIAVKLTGHNFFGMAVPDGAYFLLSDKAERDLPVARLKEAGLAEASDAFVDPKNLDNPLLRAGGP